MASVFAFQSLEVVGEEVVSKTNRIFTEEASYGSPKI